MSEFTVVIKPKKVKEADPPLTVFEVALEEGTGVWKESFGSVEQMQSFVLGIRALAHMAGIDVHIPQEIP